MAVKLNQADIDTMGRQAAKSKATKEKLVNAVIELIHEKGFASASSTKIAKRAGVTWGAVQHHFGSKEDILDEILQRSHLRFHESLSSSRFIRGDSNKRVSNYVEAAWAHYQGKEYMATIEILLATRGSGDATAELSVSSARDQHIKLGRRIFHDSSASNKTLQETIYVVHCMLTGILVEGALEPDSFSAKVYIKHLKIIVHNLLY
jgi:AcrR family transcriptional regulator